MKLQNKNQSGFTLLEIIIVIIIVGVLASLALPKFFNTVEFSRSSEALNAVGGIKRSADRCAMMGGDENDYSNCATFAELGMESPGGARGAHFTYALDWTTPDYLVTATRNALDNGDSSSTIFIRVETDTQAIVRGGTQAFSGVQ